MSLVIPALNEEGAIGSVLREAMDALGDLDLEIIVVDDGSSDGTGRAADEHGAMVLRHVEPMGYGRSIMDGVRLARNDLILIADADGTYPLAEAHGLLALLDLGFDLAVGARTGPEFRGSTLKAPLRWLLRRLVEFTAGRGIPDINSGLRAFRRDDILPHFPRLCERFSFTTSMTLAFIMSGRTVGYHPVDYRRRIGTTRVRLFRDSLTTLYFILEAILFHQPLKLFLVLAGVVVLLSASLFLVAAFTQLLVAYILGVSGVLVALLMLGLGLVANLIKLVGLDGVRNHDGVRVTP